MRRWPASGVAASLVATLAASSAAASDGPAAPPPLPAPLGAVLATPAVPSPLPASPLPVAVRLSGYIQADGVLHDASSQDEVDPSTGAPLNQTRYLIRRARVHLDIDHTRMSGSLELDANTVNGPAAGLIDAEVTVRARTPDPSGRAWGNATIGLLRTPWGYEVNQRDQDRFFLERSSVSRALFPGVFDLGVRLRGGWRFVDVQIALVNGDPLGDRAFPVQDPNHAKDIVGRLGVSGVRGRVAFAAGVSGLTGTGFHRGTPETKDVLVWRDQNEDGLVQLSEIQVISGSAATPSEDFHRFALGADARLRITLPRAGRARARRRGDLGDQPRPRPRCPPIPSPPDATCASAAGSRDSCRSWARGSRSAAATIATIPTPTRPSSARWWWFPSTRTTRPGRRPRPGAGRSWIASSSSINT